MCNVWFIKLDFNNSENSLPDVAKTWIIHMLENLKFDMKNSDVGDSNTIDAIYPKDLQAHIKKSQINEDYKSCAQSESAHVLVDEIKSLKCFVNGRMGGRKDLFLSDDVFAKSVNLMDLVSVDSTRTSCFTKKYQKLFFD